MHFGSKAITIPCFSFPERSEVGVLTTKLVWAARFIKQYIFNTTEEVFDNLFHIIMLRFIPVFQLSRLKAGG